jgi:HD-GYP domain-containing protein (c-di-GMP phosphodiesterase class II)
LHSAIDWLQMLGYLLILGGVLYFIYQLLPAPEPGSEPGSPPPDRETAAPAEARKTPLEWAHEADAAEGYATGHAERVAALSLSLAEAIGLSEEERKPLELAALLHDVGEIAFEQQLLRKPGLLSQPELFRLWEHPERGARLAMSITGSPAVAEWVRWHHERWDGLGYPDGLTGSAIPLPARIIRLADSADAMLSDRPYRQAMNPEEVTAELNRLAAVSYDPDLARIFIDYVLPQYLAEREGIWH